MRQRARQQDLLRAAGRVIRAQRRAPDDDDLQEARYLLTRQLPDTISLRAAAELLGVSHTALARWVASGDVATVPDVDGRIRLPVLAVLDLYERTAGGDGGHRLERAMRAARQRAEDLDPAALLAGRPAPASRHDEAQAFSLAYHRAVADRLDEPMVLRARQALRVWAEDGRIDPRWARAWGHVLDGSVDEVAEKLRTDDQDTDDLRQNSPFAAALSEVERRKLLRATSVREVAR